MTQIFKSLKNHKVAEFLQNGGIGVIPTDTVFGIVGSALNKTTVENIYKLKNRSKDKPCIILILSILSLKIFGVKVDAKIRKILPRYWPGPYSIILPCKLKRFQYLHRGKKSLAFRVPKNKTLVNLLKNTGPLIAPSANPEGAKPASNISQAKKYFSDKIDFYSAGRSKMNHSKIVAINGNKIIIFRK